MLPSRWVMIARWLFPLFAFFSHEPVVCEFYPKPGWQSASPSQVTHRSCFLAVRHLYFFFYRFTVETRIIRTYCVQAEEQSKETFNFPAETASALLPVPGTCYNTLLVLAVGFGFRKRVRCNPVLGGYDMRRQRYVLFTVCCKLYVLEQCPAVCGAEARTDLSDCRWKENRKLLFH